MEIGGEGSEIGPYAIVLKNTKVGRDASISNSIIMDGVRIDVGAHIDGAVVGGQDVSIGKWVRIERGGVTIGGDGTYIKDHVFINKNVKIGPSGRSVKAYIMREIYYYRGDQRSRGGIVV